MGASLTDIRLWLLPSEAPVAVSDGEFGYEVDTVDLVFGGGTVARMSWAVSGYEEGLSIALDPTPASPAPLEMVSFGDVEHLPGVLGSPIVELRRGLHVVTEQGRPLLWSVAFKTDAGGEVCVALGELRDGTPHYLPDSLVVLPSVDGADSYHPPASTTSAWGSLW